MPKVPGKPKAGKGKTTVQSLILPKSKFKSKKAAKAWAKQHGYKTSGLEETSTSYRIRQFNPEHFQSGSFRTISLGDSGVKAVVGRPKKATTSKAAVTAEDLVKALGRFVGIAERYIRISIKSGR
jgi:hypothetical protein